jgi:hypothetical protein
MSHLIYTELGLQVREGSALAIADRELPDGPAPIAFVCAWCCDGSRPWRPEHVLTHGICPACAEAMRADYRATVAEGRVRA